MVLESVCYPIIAKKLKSIIFQKTTKDSKGRTWPISVTVSAIRRIRELIGIDFGNPNTLADGATLTRLSTDMVLLADVLYAALLPELSAKGLAKEDFCDSICGDALNTALYALLEAVSDFFPKAQGSLLKRVLQSARETQEKMETQAMSELEKALTHAN